MSIGRRRLPWVTIQPLRHVEIVELLAPQHAGKGLPLHQAHVGVRDPGLQHGVEGISFLPALRHQCIEVRETWRLLDADAQPHAHHDALTGRHRPTIHTGHLGAAALGINRVQYGHLR